MSGSEILSAHADTQFYAGKPTLVEPYRLAWRGIDFDVEVIAIGDNITAVMTSGACEWSTRIDPSQFVADVNCALKDACQLGQCQIDPDVKVEGRNCWRDGDFQGWFVQCGQISLGPYKAKPEADRIACDLIDGRSVSATVRADKWADIPNTER